MGIVFTFSVPIIDKYNQELEMRGILEIGTTNDGTTLYKVHQDGHWVYFSSNETQWTENKMCGKIPCNKHYKVENK